MRQVSRYSLRASSSFPAVSSAATRINFAFTSHTSSQPKTTALLLPSLKLLSPCPSARTAFSASCCSQNTSARHTLAAYASSGCFVSSKAVVNFGIKSASPWILEVAEEEAEVGRCDADAIWASERAVRVRPVAIVSLATLWPIHSWHTDTSDLAHASQSCAQALGSPPSCHCIELGLIVQGTSRPSRRCPLLTNSCCCAPERWRLSRVLS